MYISLKIFRQAYWIGTQISCLFVLSEPSHKEEFFMERWFSERCRRGDNVKTISPVLLLFWSTCPYSSSPSLPLPPLSPFPSPYSPWYSPSRLTPRPPPDPHSYVFRVWKEERDNPLEGVLWDTAKICCRKKKKPIYLYSCEWKLSLFVCVLLLQCTFSPVVWFVTRFFNCLIWSWSRYPVTLYLLQDVFVLRG